MPYALPGEVRDPAETIVFLQRVLESSSDCITVLSPEGRLGYMNPLGLQQMEIADFEKLRGEPWEILYPDRERAKVRNAFIRALTGGGNVHFEAFCPTTTGTPKWWEVILSPLKGDSGVMRRLVAVSRDITKHIESARAQESQLREKDLLMQEVHHRVKNSLQLVHSLLTMQARGAASPDAAEQLFQSAARVRTIGAIHDQLCNNPMTLDVALQPYLSGLADDIRRSMASTMGDRALIVDSPAVTWAAADVSTLGLVLTELVTNALRHGKGTVRAVFRQEEGAQAVLTVEDEGAPPAGEPRASGMGMRLMHGLLNERGGRLEIDHGADHSRFIAVMPWPRAAAAASA